MNTEKAIDTLNSTNFSIDTVLNSRNRVYNMGVICGCCGCNTSILVSEWYLNKSNAISWLCNDCIADL